MSDAARLVTAAQLEKFPDDDYRYELVEGRVIRMSPVGYQHGRLVARLLVLLDQHLRRHNLGVAVTEVGFTIASDPDTVRAPDIAFIRQNRLPAIDPRGFWQGPPDLAIEVLSPDDRPSEVRIKVEEYLACGVPLVLVINPDEKSVTTFRPSRSSTTLRGDEEILGLDEVVSGFRCTLREIFEATS